MVVVCWVALVLALLFGLVVIRGAPYVPSQKRRVQQAFTELYPLSKKDVLVDMGSGDGIVLRQASKLGAFAVGYELNPVLVLVSCFLSRRDKNIRVRLADFWLTKLPEGTTVVYAFSVSRDIKKISEKMQKEADRLQRSLSLIVFGNKLANRKASKEVGAYCLYSFRPLHDL